MDTLEGLSEVSFEGLFGDGEVFDGVGKVESRSGSKVSSMDGCKPRGLDRKVCCGVELPEEGADAGEVVGIQGGGIGAPLRQNRWMSLGKERKTPEFGASDFAPAAQDDHVFLGEHSDRGFSNKNLQLWSQSFPIPIRL